MTNEKERIALAVAQLSLKEIPSGDFKSTNNCKRIWEAFHYGRMYEELVQKEK